MPPHAPDAQLTSVWSIVVLPVFPCPVCGLLRCLSTSWRVKFYTHLSDRYTPFRTKVIAGTASEAARCRIFGGRAGVDDAIHCCGRSAFCRKRQKTSSFCHDNGRRPIFAEMPRVPGY
jgi:hypothetical protein